MGPSGLQRHAPPTPNSQLPRMMVLLCFTRERDTTLTTGLGTPGRQGRKELGVLEDLGKSQQEFCTLIFSQYMLYFVLSYQLDLNLASVNFLVTQGSLLLADTGLDTWGMGWSCYGLPFSFPGPQYK